MYMYMCSMYMYMHHIHIHYIYIHVTIHACYIMPLCTCRVKMRTQHLYAHVLRVRSELH